MAANANTPKNQPKAETKAETKPAAESKPAAETKPSPAPKDDAVEYTVVSPVRYKGVRHKAGTVLTMTVAEAKGFLTDTLKAKGEDE